MQLRQPGKGQALYKCRMRNLVKGTTLDRTYKSGDSLDEADVEDIEGQYLYRSGDNIVFMDNSNYEQYELTKEMVGDNAQWLKEATVCNITLFNNAPISIEPPAQMVFQITYCEPGARGNTATNVTKAITLETARSSKVRSF